MNQEQFDAVVSYFDDLNIELPSDVKNSIEDVFRENDNISSVECYHLEDIEQFEQDLQPINIVMMNLDGSNSGEIHNFFTYYGGVEHDLLEKIQLYDGEELHTDISNIEGSGTSKLEDTNDYTIILVEKTTWDTSASPKEAPSVENILFIYCPYSAEGIDETDLRYQGIYNEIKAGERNGN